MSLLELAAKTLKEPLFGLLLSQNQPGGIIGDIGLTLEQHDTFFESLKSMKSLLYLHSEDSRMEIQTNKGRGEIIFRLDSNEPIRFDQFVQLSLGQFHNLLQAAHPGNQNAINIQLQQVKPDVDSDLAFYHRAGKLVFESEQDSILFPAVWFDQKLDLPKSHFRDLFQRQIAGIERRHSASLIDRSKEFISRVLSTGDCSVDLVAANFDLHPRVYQRRLKKWGTNYSDILRMTRVRIAQQSLRQGESDITELALNLGYAEVSIFSRNFKVWTGKSPRKWQEDNVFNVREKTKD